MPGSAIRVLPAFLVIAWALCGCANHGGSDHSDHQVLPESGKQTFNAVARGGRVKSGCPYPQVRLCFNDPGENRCSCVSEWRMREILDPWNP